MGDIGWMVGEQDFGENKDNILIFSLYKEINYVSIRNVTAPKRRGQK